MSYPLRLLVVLFALFLAPPAVGADDKPPAKPEKPGDARRAALERAGYTPVPLAVEPRHLAFSGDAVIGTEKVKFDLDSGATWSSIDLKLATRLKLKLGGEAASLGLDGKQVGRWAYVPGLKLGRYDTRKDFPNVPAQAVDLSGRPGAPGGVLGMEVFDPRAAVIDYPARTMYLRPTFTTVWPRLEGKWAAVRYEFDGNKGRYKPGDGAVEFKGGRVRFTSKDGVKEWGFHLEDELDLYRVGLFDPKADELADGFRYAGGGLLLRLNGDTLSLVMGEPDEFGAPAGSGLLLVEYERAK